MQILNLEKDLARDREELTRLVARLNQLGDEKFDLENQRDEAAREAETAKTSLAEARSRLVALEDALSTLGHDSLKLYEQLEAAQEAATRLKVEVGQAQEKKASLEKQLFRLTADNDEKQAHATAATRLEVKGHDLTAARAHLEEAIGERYRVELWTQVHDHHLRPLAGEAEDKRAKELRDLIDRMGEINLHAIEEYNELETRYTFLSGQKGDLEKALAQLEEAIEKINKTSVKRFREVFDHGGGAIGRREGDDGGGAHLRHLPHQAVAVLLARRGRRAARRGQRRSLQRPDSRDDRPLAVHHHHAQQADDADRRHALRRDHGGAGHLQAGQRQPVDDGQGADQASREPHRRLIHSFK